MPKKRKRTPEKTPRELVRQAKREQTSVPHSSAKLPDEVYQAVEQAEREASGGKLPAVVIHPPGTPMADALVMMKLSTFQRYFDAQPTKPAANEGD